MSSISLLFRSICFVVLISCMVSAVSAGEFERSERLSTERSGKGGADLCAGFANPGSCPINCFQADPVCGADGVTYSCGCPDAACHGVRVIKKGAC